MNAFTRELHSKGWTLKALAEFLKMPLRNLSRIAKNPKGIHWLAIRDGLPHKSDRES